MGAKITIKWQNLLLKIITWVLLEIVLNLVGFDDLANYHEFIVEVKKRYIYQIYNGNSTLVVQDSFKKSFSASSHSFPFPL